MSIAISAIANTPMRIAAINSGVCNALKKYVLGGTCSAVITAKFIQLKFIILLTTYPLLLIKNDGTKNSIRTINKNNPFSLRKEVSYFADKLSFVNCS